MKFTFSADKSFCANLNGASSKDKNLKFDILFPITKLGSITTQPRKVLISGDELCIEELDSALDESGSFMQRTFYRPQIFTVSIPLKQGDFNFSKSLVDNNNLIIREDKSSDAKVNIMLMRLINVDFQEDNLNI